MDKFPQNFNMALGGATQHAIVPNCCHRKMGKGY